MNIAAHDDMSDYEYVAQKLRLDISPQPKEIVTDQKTGETSGLGQDYVVVARSTESIPHPLTRILSYRTFKPTGQNYIRVIFWESINTDALCITREDVTRILGDSFPARYFHAYSVNYIYHFKRRNITELVVTFDSDSSQCVNRISFYQNQP